MMSTEVGLVKHRGASAPGLRRAQPMAMAAQRAGATGRRPPGALRSQPGALDSSSLTVAAEPGSPTRYDVSATRKRVVSQLLESGRFSRPAPFKRASCSCAWFTELAAGRVGRLTTTGGYSTFDVGDHSTGIAATASGLEVTDSTGGAVGDLARLVPPGHHAVILPSGPSPASSTVGIGTGTTLEWTQLAPTSQSVSDASGMGLFTSGSLYPGSDFSFRFPAAGTYPYAVAPAGTVAPPANGTVKVAPYGFQIAFGTYVTVKWAAESAPSGYRYDVQVETPGGTYENWMKGTTVWSGVFDTDGTQGVYYFRARLRNLTNGAHSGWSPPAAVFVQGTPFGTTP